MYAVRADASFELSGLPPGPCSLQVLAGAPRENEHGRGFMLSHPPTSPPAWHPVETPYAFEVEAGGTLELTLDLTARPPCRLRGRIDVGRALFVPDPDARGGDLAHTPRVVLAGGSVEDYASRADYDAAGAFELAAWTPGTYDLRLFVSLEGGGMHVYDRIDLEQGEVRWAFVPRFGSLHVTSAAGHVPDERVRVRWGGETWLSAILTSSEVTADGRQFRQVPEGPVEIQTRNGERVLARGRVRAGERTEIRLD